MKADQIKTADMVENFIRSLVCDTEADPQSVFTGVHNALDYNLREDDKDLKELFRGFDISLAALRAMQK